MCVCLQYHLRVEGDAQRMQNSAAQFVVTTFKLGLEWHIAPNKPSEIKMQSQSSN